MPAIYIHIPFCKQKCKYCDFNSYAGLDFLYESYAGVLASEIAFRASQLEGLNVNSIYMGGGTPTLIDPTYIDAMLTAVDKHFSIASDAEVSMEANPETVNVKQLTELKRAGVNRLSIGFQSLDDDRLLVLGRKHSAQQAVNAFRMAREAGFDNVSTDLIFGVPGQSLAAWAITLEQVASLEPDHLSCYGLIVEPNTVLEREMESGLIRATDEDLQADMFMYTIESLVESGYEHYEISNYAKPGKSCKHNLTYWDNYDYIGFGAGAHSKLKGKRFCNLRAVDDYIQAAGTHSYVAEQIDLSVEDEMSETVFLGLRKIKGIDLEWFEGRFGRSVYDVYGAEVDALTRDGLLTERDGSLKLTHKGILLGNEVFSRFV